MVFITILPVHGNQVPNNWRATFNVWPCDRVLLLFPSSHNPDAKPLNKQTESWADIECLGLTLQYYTSQLVQCTYIEYTVLQLITFSLSSSYMVGSRGRMGSTFDNLMFLDPKTPRLTLR